MDVIGHNDIPPDKPCVRVAARLEKDRMEHIRRQMIPARLNGERHKQDHRRMVPFDRRNMRRSFPLR